MTVHVLQLRDLKMGFARVTEAYRETGGAIDVAGERGYTLAQVVPEEGFQGDARALLRITGEQFRTHRYRVAYAAYWGLRWLVEQRGGNFVILPPADCRSRISPTALGVRWTLRSRTGREST
jgi:hypothetical protein